MKMVLENPTIAPGILRKKCDPFSPDSIHQMNDEALQRMLKSPFEYLNVDPYQQPQKEAPETLQQWLTSRGQKLIVDDVIYSAQKFYSHALNADAFQAFAEQNAFCRIPYVRILGKAAKNMQQEAKRKELISCQEG